MEVIWYEPECVYNQRKDNMAKQSEKDHKTSLKETAKGDHAKLKENVKATGLDMKANIKEVFGADATDDRNAAAAHRTQATVEEVKHGAKSAAYEAKSKVEGAAGY